MLLWFIKIHRKIFYFKNIFFLILFFGFNFSGQIKGISKPLFYPSFKKEVLTTSSSFITKAIEKTGNSVVTIDAQRLIKSRRISRDSRIFLEPYFEKLLGLELPYEIEPRIENSQGSGFIFDDGLIMTNAHVINNSEKLIVGLSNGQKFRGEVIGKDLLTDIAVIRLEGKGPWPKATLGNSDNIKVGD